MCIGDISVPHLPESYDWLGYWGKHMKAQGFKTIREYQKVGGGGVCENLVLLKNSACRIYAIHCRRKTYLITDHKLMPTKGTCQEY